MRAKVNIWFNEIPDTTRWPAARHAGALRLLAGRTAPDIWRIGYHFRRVRMMLGTDFDSWLREELNWREPAAAERCIRACRDTDLGRLLDHNADALAALCAIIGGEAAPDHGPAILDARRLDGPPRGADLSTPAVALALRRAHEALLSPACAPIRGHLAGIGIRDEALRATRLGYLDAPVQVGPWLLLPRGIVLSCAGAGGAPCALWSLDADLGSPVAIAGDPAAPLLLAGSGRGPRAHLLLQGLPRGLRLWQRGREHADVSIGVVGPPPDGGAFPDPLATYRAVVDARGVTVRWASAPDRQAPDLDQADLRHLAAVLDLLRRELKGARRASLRP